MLDRTPETVAGLDVSYEDGTRRAVAAAVTLELATLKVLEVSLVEGQAPAEYVPGLLAQREAPLLLDAWGRLARKPDVLVCDGYGIAHPRRYGLACHIGVQTGTPTFGVAKTPFLATFSEPGAERGAWSDLMLDGDVVGRALRTRAGVKPVFVSVGQGIDLELAAEVTLVMCPKFRQPQCIREADSRSRMALRGETDR